MKSMHLQEQYPSGTAGAALTGSYQTCVLNTTLYNAIPGASLNPANGRVTLPAGDYEVQGNVAYGSGPQRAGLFDVTHSVFLSNGLNNPRPLGTAQAGPYASVKSFFHLNVQTDIELQLFITSGSGGSPISDGQPEVYSELVIQAF